MLRHVRILGQGAVHVVLVPGVHFLRDVGDLASQRGPVVLREPVHVLQFRTGELVGLRDVRRRVDQDSRAQLRHVVSGDGREPLEAERQAQFTLAQRTQRQPGQDGVLDEDGRPHVDGRDAGPVQHLLGRSSGPDAAVTSP